VRAMVTHRFGLEGAGFFDVAWTISMMYVGVITQSFGTYYLPTLAGIKNEKDRNALMQRVFRFSIILMVPVIVAVISMKSLVVSLLYSDKFLPALEMIRWMLIGDYFKVSAFVLAFPMLAYADMRTFLWSETVFISIQALGVYIAIMHWGHMEGIGITFLIVYAAYFLFTISYCYQRFGFFLSKMLFSWWLGGLFLVTLVSIASWGQNSVNVGNALLFLVASGAMSWMLLSKHEQKWVLNFITKGGYSN